MQRYNLHHRLPRQAYYPIEKSFAQQEKQIEGTLVTSLPVLIWNILNGVP